MQKNDYSYVENLEVINFDIEKARLICGPSLKKIQKNNSTTTLEKEKSEESEAS